MDMDLVTPINVNISFFAKPARWSERHQRLFRGSSTIRGEQIAAYLGAKLGPTEGYENDICIYVKPWEDFTFEKHSYIDILDVPTRTFLKFSKLHIPIIVCSLFAYEYFSKLCPDNKIIFIPQHHCNYERFRRNRPEVTTVGISGDASSFRYPIVDVKERLKKIGMELLVEKRIVVRSDAVNFYKKIDIQIDWRKNPWLTKNAMKLYNAASFGIPTVGLKQQIYKEFEGYYIPVTTMDEMIKEIVKLKEDKEHYSRYSELIVPKAEEYHISSIAKLYKQLN
jgi:hypothetical protein